MGVKFTITGVTTGLRSHTRIMDIKEIAKKVVDGGNPEEVLKDLTPDVTAQVWGEVLVQRKAAADAELAVINARKKERERVENDIEGTNKKVADDIRGQLRGEQIDISLNLAEDKLKSRGINLTPEMKAKIKEEFPRYDSGKFDATLIVDDLLKTYLALNSNQILDSFKKAEDGSRGAFDFNAGSASPGSAGAGTQPEPPMSPYVRNAIQAAAKFGVNLSREEAERAEKAGTDWKVFGAKPKA